ncbi:MAG TPA: hypothetical protein VFV72_05235 [Candidatus Limnocylindrales bacterium]|nr:hypothetical protein [Candidatus Limnocylindrales bacterium]
MRAASRIVLTVAAALVATLLSTALALAKGEGGIVTLAAPIPSDAEPGSTITVEFAAFFVAENGRVPVQGSPMVLKLIGADGTTTESDAVATGKVGTYRVSVEVPATGIDRAVFGLRGSSTGPDGSTELADMPFDVDGVLFAMSHPNPAPPAAAPAPPAAQPTPTTAPDYRPALVVGLAVLVGIAALASVAVVGRRRSVRTT